MEKTTKLSKALKEIEKVSEKYNIRLAFGYWVDTSGDKVIIQMNCKTEELTSGINKLIHQDERVAEIAVYVIGEYMKDEVLKKLLEEVKKVDSKKKPTKKAKK